MARDEASGCSRFMTMVESQISEKSYKLCGSDTGYGIEAAFRIHVVPKLYFHLRRILAGKPCVDIQILYTGIYNCDFQLLSQANLFNIFRSLGEISSLFSRIRSPFWLIFEQSHSMRKVALCRRKSVVNPGRQDHEVPLLQRATNPSFILISDLSRQNVRRSMYHTSK